MSEIRIDTNEGWLQYTTIKHIFNYIEYSGSRKMSPGAVRSVYTVANDMDLMHAFYEGVLELPLAFRDRDNWCQFKTGQVSFALSSPSEAARGARGSVIVFDPIDVTAFAQRIERLGGRHLSSRDMGPHGSVATFADPENNLFQMHVRPG
jgi:predicted enzyme related to lactoylglutathione lyase